MMAERVLEGKKMREILFRGKRVYNGEWAESKCPTATMSCGVERYDFIPETVGQFTGLTDKNGKKIFEGDIIRELDGSMDGIPRAVCWDEDYMRFDCPLVRKHWAYGFNACGLWLMQSKNIEVIGNIHDNPELLEA
jgi:uncharacterized phage protein (TIGR01671 family)